MQRARASINYGAGSPGVITMYTTSTPAEDGTTAQATMDRLGAAVEAARSLLHESVTVVSDSYVDELNPATGALTASWSVTGFSKVGSSAGTELPPATALCVTWLTNSYINGRRLRGRTFLSPLGAGQLESNGTPNSFAATILDSFGSSWSDNSGDGPNTVVWHRPTPGNPGSAQPIVGYRRVDKYAVLRSRRD